ncbi:MAG: GNAT family N-acetyltransferase [Sulfurimonas sp.]
MQIRTLKIEELDLLFLHSKNMGWHNEIILTISLQKVYPNDFFIAYLKNELLGFIIALKHSEEVGFISHFLIVKKFRRYGYGKSLFNFALRHLNGRQIALDSFQETQNFYVEAGFTSYFDVTTYKFSTGSVTLPKQQLNTTRIIKNLNLHNKNEYIKTILLNKRVTYKAIDDKTFAFTFKYRDGYKINIESKDINDAIILFFELTHHLKPGTNIYLQTTPLYPILEALVKLLKMSTDSKLVRMYNKIIN